ncbi:MAG: dihydrolipoyl dehydrogenase [Herminiimonas sp.]|nr:dihydrolipoyl dehydrogenase [Herminiimonas sp.]
MKFIEADVAVIGAGSAGLAAYRAARSHGGRVVLIEGGPYGTTCARVGCMPSKLLIAAAEAAHMISLAPAFGVHAGALRIDGRAVMARVRQERDRFVGFVVDGIEQIPETDRLRGHARFIAPGCLQIDDELQVRAGRIVIATGSRPQIPAELLGAGDRLVTNEQVFDWDDLPASVAVVGTGVIGLEIGQALHRLGVRVALFGRGMQLAGISDPMVLASARQAFGAELDLRSGTRVVQAVRNDDGVALVWTAADGTEQREQFAYVLAATGRVANVERLRLDARGLALDARGVPIFDSRTMQCGETGIFVAGDVAGERALLHEAADHGRIAGDNAGRFPDVQPGLRRAPLAIAFTDPQVAVVGCGFHALEAAHTASGEVSFADQGRSRVMLQNRGLLRVYGAYGSGRFLGAELCGPRGEHLAHLMAWALQNEMTVAQMLQMPFYHPVVEEGLRTALRELNEKLHHGTPEIERCADCTPGM